MLFGACGHDRAMKPVLILQHLSGDGPAYLGTWLQRQGLPFELRNTEAGQDFPEHMDGHSALAILGGEMSANDPLPSLRRAELLILDAMARGRPVIGHCLGGQLMARALGARIQRSPQPEVGWHAIELFDTPQTRDWFGDAGSATVFQWHEEAFELPPGAVGLAGGKTVIVASSRGGLYSTTEAGRATEHQESYLQVIFGFFGITDVRFVRAEGLAMGDAARAAALASARNEIRAATAETAEAANQAQNVLAA